MALILVVMIVGLAALVASGNEFGLRGLCLVAGGFVGGAAVAVATRVPRLRRPAPVIGMAALPACWIVIGVLPGSAFGADSSNAAAAVHGFGVCAAVVGLMRLTGPNRA